MHLIDEEKTTFITSIENYCYKVMPFRLKNAGATYQRLMDKNFAKYIGVLMEVYIDNMMVKMKAEEELLQSLEIVFAYLRKHRRRQNPHKCVVVEAGKFLGFMLTNRGIEANLDKCKAILEMKCPNSVKDVQRLTGRIASFSRFLAASARKASPLFSLLKKENNFEWMPECEAAFQEFKFYLLIPLILCKPEIGKPLFLYLSITNSAIADVLVQEDAKPQFPVYFINKTLQGQKFGIKNWRKWL